MKNLLQKQLEELLERYSLLIKNFKIPESVLETLEKFKTDYYDNTDIFFDKIEYYHIADLVKFENKFVFVVLLE